MIAPAKSILLTFDVEEWFQVENLRPRAPLDRWPAMERRAQIGTLALLDSLDRAAEERGLPVLATFFVLGWVAQRDPGLVREIRRRGHEVASHGMDHRLLDGLSDSELKTGLADSKKVLEDITGEAVHGFRAPSFTVSGRVLAAVREAGYGYDAGYNSFAAHGRYGRLDTQGFPRRGIAMEASPGFFELGVSNLSLGRTVLPWGGGAYFRLMPLALYLAGMGLVLGREEAFVFYAHPWEADAAQPRLPGLPAFARFKHYTGIPGFLQKLGGLLDRFSGCGFPTCRGYLEAVCR